MKFLLGIVISFFICSCVSSSALSSEGGKRKIALTNITIIDVETGKSINNQSVVLQGEKIINIGLTSHMQLDKNITIIDASNKYLIPGLWDMHVHLEFGGKEVLPYFVANGVTGVRDMGSNSFDSINNWRDEVIKGDLPGPRIITSGPMIDGPFITDKLRVTVENEIQARNAVDSLANLGVDFIKVHQQISKEAYLAVTDQAKKYQISVVGHHPALVSTKEVIEAGQKSIEHIFGVPRPSSGLYPVLKEKEIAVTPTLVVTDKIARFNELSTNNDNRIRFISPALQFFWEEQTAAWGENTEATIAIMSKMFPDFLEGTSLLHEAGINLLAGTDYGVVYIYPGSSLHEELELMVKAGLKPFEALQTATINPAKFLNKEMTMGTVKVGKFADLVVLNSNPLENISNTQDIFLVISNGRVYNKEELQKILN